MNVRNFLLTIGSLMLSQALHAASMTPAGAGAVLTCGSPEVLRGLAEAVQSTNRLMPDLIYNFDDVKGLPSGKGGGKGLTCEALLQLLEGQDKRLVDTVKLAYTVKSNAKGKGFTITFEPKR